MTNTNRIFPAGNSKIEVTEVIGGLIGNGALEIQNHLYRCLDEGRRYQIIDLEHVNQIDGLGIAMLENFLSRGLQLRLINVKPEVRSIMMMAQRESFFQIIYNEKDRTKAASLFEKDLFEKKVIPENDVLKKRHHLRVNTALPAEFKLHKDQGTASIRANILNLSEGGALAGHMVVMNVNREEIVNYQGMVGREISDLNFKLNGDSTSITIRGRCIREFTNGDSRYAGVRFHEISHCQREIIRAFVDAHK